MFGIGMLMILGAEMCVTTSCLVHRLLLQTGRLAVCVCCPVHLMITFDLMQAPHWETQ